MRLRLALLLALAETSNTTGRPHSIEKGRNLRVDRNLHSHLSPYQTQDKLSRRHKSKLARDDHGERDSFIPIDERANYEYSQTIDGVEVNVNVNVNVEVNTGGSGSIPSPTSSPTTECLRWDISYVTEMKNQYFKYQYYGKSGKSSKSGSKSGKSEGKSSKSEGKSGKSKAEKIMMKQVEVQKEVKTCIERRTPNPTIAPTMVQLITASPTPRPSEIVETVSFIISIPAFYYGFIFDLMILFVTLHFPKATNASNSHPHHDQYHSRSCGNYLPSY